MERFYSFAVVIKGRNYKIRQADVLKELHWKDGLEKASDLFNFSWLGINYRENNILYMESRLIVNAN
jgi:hypothetical protein